MEARLYRRLVAIQLRGQMRYRTSFAVQVIGNFGIHLVELAGILILFQRFNTLGGWRVGEIAFLYGLSAISLNLANGIAAGCADFDEQVRRGAFDRVLTRPIGTFTQVLASDIQLRRLGGLLQGVLAFVIALRLIDVPWTAGRVLYLPVVIVSATVIFMALFALEAVLCFWTTEGTEMINAFTYGGGELASYPIHVFDRWLRRLFLFVIPLGFVIYAPALYLLDKPDPLGLPDWTRFVAPLAAAAFALATAAIWRLGVRHYRSTGS